MAPGSARVPVIAGNWKMHKTQAETREFFAAFLPLVAGAKHCEIVVAPAFTALAAAVDAARDSGVMIGAQDFFGSRRAPSPAKFPPACWSKAAAGR